MLRAMSIARIAPWVLALASTACVRHEAHRWDSDNPGESAVRPAARLDATKECARVLGGQAADVHLEACGDDGGELFRVGYVEIDDQGRAWDLQQMHGALQFIDTGHEDGALVVVFVHGWRHDAGVDDSNVADFRRVLYTLARAEREAGTGRAVRGVYLGWRARPFRTTPVMTFWARKKGAHRVGERDGGLVIDHVGARIERWRAQETSDGAPPRTRALIVGHSFGAAVVHSAIHRQLERRILREATLPEGEDPGLAYDLVALVNPAFEAGRLRPLYELSSTQPVDSDDTPVLLVVTTKADCNTDRHFRMGMSGIRGEGVYRDKTEKKQRKTGAGHWPWPVRHEAEAIVCGDAVSDDVFSPDQVHFEGGEGDVEPTGTPTPTTSRKHRRASGCRYEVHDHDTTCRFAPTAQVDPVVVVYDTQSELMDHHSDAFNSALWTFVWSVAGEVLRVPAPPPPEAADEPVLSPPAPDEPTPFVAEDPAPPDESSPEGPSSPPT